MNLLVTGGAGFIGSSYVRLVRRTRPADWPATRYERKAIAAGRRPAFLRLRRRPRAAAR